MERRRAVTRGCAAMHWAARSSRLPWVLLFAVAAVTSGCRKKPPPPGPDAPGDPLGVTIRCRAPVVGDRWRIVKTTTAETKSRGDGPSIETRFEADEERNEHVLAVEDGTVTRLEVSYARHGRRTIVRGAPDQLGSAPVVDKTYLLERLPEGGVAISFDGRHASVAEQQIVRQDYFSFGRPSENLAAYCDMAFTPGQIVGDPSGELAAQRKRSLAQLGEGTSVSDLTTRFVRRDRGAALFALVTDVKTAGSFTHTRHQMWVRPSDGAFTRTETESSTEVDAVALGPSGVRATTKTFYVEQREGP